MVSSTGQEAFKEKKKIIHVPGDEPRVLFVHPGSQALYCDSMDTPGKVRVGYTVDQLTMG